MKVLSSLLSVWLIGELASAAKLDIAKVDSLPTHSCEIEDIELEARYDNQPNRIILSLRNAKNVSHLSCPRSAWIPAGARDEALRLYEILRDAKESSCLTTGGVTSTRASIQCDAGFNVRSKVH